MIRKLHIRFVVVIMTIVTLMLCIIFGTVYHFTSTGMEKESIAMMERIAQSPVQLRQPNAPAGELQLPFFTLELSRQQELISKTGGYYDLSDEDFLNDLIEKVTDSRESTGKLKEYNLRFCRAETPIGYRLVFADMSSEQAALAQLLRTDVLIGGAGLLAFLGISILLSVWMVRPVERAWKQQKQFIADASHELKTPLTVITTNAELLQSTEAPAEVRSFSDNILFMAQHMRKLVEQMLELARADQQEQAIRTPVDLSALVTEESLAFEAVLYEKGLTVQWEIEAGISVLGSEGELRRVVDILLDNAAKYTALRGDVVCALKRDGRKKCLLSVATTGQALSEEDLQNIFKRFVRLDEARSRNGSFGLGLSIALTTVEAHGGKIRAESRDGVNTFFVQLPRIPGEG